VPNKAVKLHAQVEIQSALLKLIIRPWEQLAHNKHKTDLGYENDVSFHIPDYSKPIQFQSVEFLHDTSPSTIPDFAPLPQQQQHIVK